MSHHIVEARGLSFRYPDGTAALDDVTFRILHGECVAVVGANGAGKSTLLHHLCGILAPQRGEVRIGETPLTRESLPLIRRSVGLVFQDPDDQLFMPTVYEDVAFGPRNLGLSEEQVAERVAESLSRVGGDTLRDRPPYKLSGGEKRVAAIAAVLAVGPDVLVMDEPSSNLDPRARRRLIGLLDSFHHSRIIATHDLDLVLDICPRTIVMQRGRVLADGSTTEMFSDESLLAAAGLEKPLRMQGCPVCAKAGR